MNPTQVVSYIDASSHALATHRRNVSRGGDPTSSELRFAMHGAGHLHVQLWWCGVPSPVARELLWDAVDVQGVEEPQARDFVRTLAERTGARVSSQAATALRWRRASDVPLFAIHPQRYRVLHPLGKPMAQSATAGTGWGFTQAALQDACDAYMRAEREDMGRTCLRWKVGTASRRAFNDATQLAMFYGDFCASGKNIFEFPPHLTEMFARTDVTDIPLEAINLPYRSLYLNFGAQPNLEVEPGWLADGAYVSVVGDKAAIQFAMTALPSDHDCYPRWSEHPEPSYVQALDAARLKLGVGEAIDLVHADKVAELRSQLAGLPDLPEGVQDATPANARDELARLEQKHAAWGQMLRLVVNALAYLSTYPEDIDRRWPPGVPQSLYVQTQDGTHKQKRNAESKLTELGYSVIHYCGKSLAPRNRGLARDGSSTDAAKQATWVRGHWLRQVYGEGRALRKLQWRMPVLRNAGLAEADEVGGHIYQVD